MGLQYLNRLVGEGAAAKLADNDASPSIGDKKLVIAPDVPPAKITAFDDVKNGHEWIIQPGAADLIIGYVAGLIETPNRVDFPLRTAATGGVSIDLYKENGVVRFRGAAGAARFTDAGAVADNAVIALAAGQRKTLLARSYTGVEGLADGEFASLIPPATGDVTFTHAGSPATGQAFDLDQDTNVVIPGGSSSAFIVQRVGATIRLSGGLSGGGAGEVDTLAALKLISVGTPRFEAGSVVRTKGRLAAGDGLGTEYVLLSSLANTVFEERLAPLLTPRAAYAPDDYFLIQLASGFAAPRNLIERGVAHVRDAGGKADLEIGNFTTPSETTGTDAAPALNRITSFIRNRAYLGEIFNNIFYPVSTIEDDGGFYRIDSDVFFCNISPVYQNIKLDLTGKYCAVGLQGGAVFDFTNCRNFVHSAYEVIGLQDSIGAFPARGVVLCRQSGSEIGVHGLAGDCVGHVFNGTAAKGWFSHAALSAVNSCETNYFYAVKVFNSANDDEVGLPVTITAYANNGSGATRITVPSHGLNGTDAFALASTPEHNDIYTLGVNATLIDANTIDLLSSPFVATTPGAGQIRKLGRHILGLPLHVDVDNEGEFASRFFSKNYTAVANQGGNARFTAPSHGLTTGRKINLESGSYIATSVAVTVIDANTFDTTLPFTSTASGVFYVQPDPWLFGQNEFLLYGAELNNGSRGVGARFRGTMSSVGFVDGCYLANADHVSGVSFSGDFSALHLDLHVEVTSVARFELDQRFGTVNLHLAKAVAHGLDQKAMFASLRKAGNFSAITGKIDIYREVFSLRPNAAAPLIFSRGAAIAFQGDMELRRRMPSLLSDLRGASILHGNISYFGPRTDYNALHVPGNTNVVLTTYEDLAPMKRSSNVDGIIEEYEGGGGVYFNGLKFPVLGAQPASPVTGGLYYSNGAWGAGVGLHEYTGAAFVKLAAAGGAAGLGANNFTGAQTITGATEFFTAVAGVSTHAGANAGPYILLNRLSASPAAGDLGGNLTFQFRDSAAATFPAALIQSRLIDPTAGSKDASISFDVMVSDQLLTRMSIGAGVFLDGASDAGKSTFNVSTNANANAGYYVNGIKVLGAPGAAIPNATDAATTQQGHNALLAVLRAHGIILT